MPTAERKKREGCIFPTLTFIAGGVIFGGGAYAYLSGFSYHPTLDQSSLFEMSGKPVEKVQGGIFQRDGSPFISNSEKDAEGRERFYLKCEVEGSYIIQGKKYLILPGDIKCASEVR